MTFSFRTTPTRTAVGLVVSLSLSLSLAGCRDAVQPDAAAEAVMPSAVAAPEAPEATWQPRPTGTESSLRGLSAVSSQVAWAGGSEGTVLRTVDGGATWSRHPVPGAEELQFRDIEAFDDQRAVLMTAGQPARLYTTDDGGTTFTVVHESPFEGAFFDSMAFWNADQGIVMSDPVEGHLLLLTTGDGGRNWQRVPPSALPSTVEGEAGFAASGTNVAVAGENQVWIGTGGAAARVFSSRDAGKSWQVTSTPVRAGAPSQGIFSVAFRDAEHGLAVGGDYEDAENPEANSARSLDGGQTWQPLTGSAPRGHRACVVYLPGQPSADMQTTWVAVGRAGTDLSTDDGETWQALSEEGFYVADVAADGSVWAAGDLGRVAKLQWASLAQ